MLAPGNHRVALPRSGLFTRILRSGEGAPVLLLHGSPDSASEWDAVRGALGGGYACCAPDLPGLGESPGATGFQYTAPEMDLFVDEVLEAWGVSRPIVLVVHDIGGVFGLPWAARNPHRVRGIVITNTAVFDDFRWFAAARLWGRTDPVGATLARLGMRLLGAKDAAVFRGLARRRSPEIADVDVDRMAREFARNPTARRSTLKIFRRIVARGYFADVGAQMESLTRTVPTRVLWGSGDPYVPARYARAFEGARVQEYHGAGHWVPLSRPKAIAAAVCDLTEA